jgi:rare lipoprotein A
MRSIASLVLVLSLTSILVGSVSDAKTKKALHSRSSQKGTASWYGANHQGKLTANGERFNMNSLTAAHRTLPMNSMVKVKSLTTGKSVTVRINDRGPFAKNRIIDVSKAAAKQLGFMKRGTDRVEITLIPFSPRKPANH